MIDSVIRDDCLNALPKLADASVHLILSDIPYGIGVDEWDVLHSNTNSALLGSSPAQQKAGAVFQKRGKPLNGWSAADREIPLQYYEWCKSWSAQWLRVLKPGGSAIVFAGRRLAHRCITAMEDAGFSVYERGTQNLASLTTMMSETKSRLHSAKRKSGF